jgi:hypothetical protein
MKTSIKFMGGKFNKARIFAVGDNQQSSLNFKS